DRFNDKPVVVTGVVDVNQRGLWNYRCGLWLERISVLHPSPKPSENDTLKKKEKQKGGSNTREKSRRKKAEGVSLEKKQKGSVCDSRCFGEEQKGEGTVGVSLCFSRFLSRSRSSRRSNFAEWLGWFDSRYP